MKKIVRLLRDKKSIAGGGTTGRLCFGDDVVFTLEPDAKNPFHAAHPCIPAGDYRITVSMSPHFKEMLPELSGVPGRGEILAHSGDTVKDTLGCILLFLRSWPSGRGTSRLAKNKFRDWCQSQIRQGHTIEIRVRWSV